MEYTPGTHLIATLNVQDSARIANYASFRLLINELIHTHKLRKLGEVYHNFDPAGFTAVICLSESHISIHTWPEHGKVNLEIYLSNYERVNDGIVVDVFRSIVEHFAARVENENIIRR